MTAQPGRFADTIEIRKYPNRRYYDKTRSQHLTLEEIRALIPEGANVRIIDSQTGADITSKTLMQMILEFNASKLDLFTVPLLVEILRVNDQVVKGFFEKFFNQALLSFFAFQRQLEKQLRGGGVLPSLFPGFGPWQAPAPERSEQQASGTKVEPVSKPDEVLAETVSQLQRQFEALQAQLAERPAQRLKRRKRTR
jgi:polyhydroxyalkanoate synthesis repressor PhaR